LTAEDCNYILKKQFPVDPVQLQWNGHWTRNTLEWSFSLLSYWVTEFKFLRYDRYYRVKKYSLHNDGWGVYFGTPPPPPPL
jgi:hypothetical protein